VVAGVADGTVAGFGLLSYQLALQAIADLAARQGPGPVVPGPVVPGPVVPETADPGTVAPGTVAPGTVDQEPLAPETVQTPR